jgi:hypothetical protein
MAGLRNFIYKQYRGEDGYFKEKEGNPPVWKPEGWFDSIFLKFKDWLWRPVIEQAIQDYQLYDFDVVHFESGSDFLKNEFFVKELHERGKKIIAHYHGEDMRARGVMPIIDDLSDLNLTNEVDLLDKHPNLDYLFLPFDTNQFVPKYGLNKTIQVAHAPTNRFYKGSNNIISVCEKLESEGLIKFDLIENLPHATAIKRKAKSDIFIDQIGDRGGWGYGMNSVESLSMGICTLTEINDKYNSFIPDHPFVNVNQNNFDSVLRDLSQDRQKIEAKGIDARNWVVKNHDITKVSEKLYQYYKDMGLPV